MSDRERIKRAVVEVKHPTKLRSTGIILHQCSEEQVQGFLEGLSEIGFDPETARIVEVTHLEFSEPPRNISDYQRAMCWTGEVCVETYSLKEGDPFAVYRIKVGNEIHGYDVGTMPFRVVDYFGSFEYFKGMRRVRIRESAVARTQMSDD